MVSKRMPVIRLYNGFTHLYLYVSVVSVIKSNDMPPVRCNNGDKLVHGHGDFNGHKF
jgi:hypothetical protein